MTVCFFQLEKKNEGAANFSLQNQYFWWNIRYYKVSTCQLLGSSKNVK